MGSMDKLFSTQHISGIWQGGEDLEVLKYIWGAPGHINGAELKEDHCIMEATFEGRAKYTGVRTVAAAADICHRACTSRGSNLYIGKNTYIHRTKHFREETLFALKCIVIDIDNHFSSADEVCRGVNLFLRELREDHDRYGIPLPGAAIYTGNGVQLCYGLKSASGQLSFLSHVIAQRLCDLYGSFLYDHPISCDGLSVDETASIRVTGLCRVPGTYNSEAGCYSQGALLSDKRWDINELKGAIGAEVHLKQECSPSGSKSHAGHQRGSGSSRGRFAAHLLSTLEDLAESGDYRSREVLCHIYHAMMLSYGFNADEAREAVLSLNKKFKDPLGQGELRSLIRCNETHHYKYSEGGIFKSVGASEEAVAAYYAKKVALMKPRDYEGENRARDMASREKRVAWHNEIRDLAEQGLDAVAISQITGRDKRTVRKYMGTPMERADDFPAKMEPEQNMATVPAKAATSDDTTPQRREPEHAADAISAETASGDDTALQRRAVSLYKRGFRSNDKIGRIIGISESEVAGYIRDYKEYSAAKGHAKSDKRALEHMLEDVNLLIDELVDLPHLDEAPPDLRNLRASLWDLNSRIIQPLNTLTYAEQTQNYRNRRSAYDEVHALVPRLSEDLYMLSLLCGDYKTTGQLDLCGGTSA